MMNTTGEASCQQRQRVPSIVEEEEEEKRGGDVMTRTGTLFDLDLLDCPICCNALTMSIFQCDNGHIACSDCCVELRNKCATCTLPIGNYRSRIMERVVEAVIVPSPSSKHGCPENGVNEAEEAEKHGGDVVTPSGILFDLDLLNCPICCQPLKTPIFQCDNGHIACSSCCTEVRHKCPSCTFPIGNYRSLIMERVVEAVIVPCPNAIRGCTKKFSYGKELVHEKKCSFALCHCPGPNCNYNGVYTDLYSHYYANHNNSWNQFGCGRFAGAWMHIRDKILILQESREGPLVAIQCFEEPHGVYVSVNCIAPSAPGVGEYSYELSYCKIACYDTMSLKSKMNRIQKVSFQTPEKDFMLIPSYFLPQWPTLKMNICIRKLKKNEKDAIEEEDDDEEAANDEEAADEEDDEEE